MIFQTPDLPIAVESNSTYGSPIHDSIINNACKNKDACKRFNSK